MVKIKIKHIKPGKTRDFNGLMYKTEVRAKWIQENLDKYIDVVDLTYNYVTREKAMNIAYKDTNSIDSYWVDNLQSLSDATGVETPKIFDYIPEIGGHRSTSVGDIMEVQVGDNEPVVYFVDSYKFSEVYDR